MKDFWKIFKWVQLAVLAGLLMAVLFFVGVSYGLLGSMPSTEYIENPQSALATEIYSADYELLGTIYVENRVEVPYEDISPHLVNALVSTEDKRYHTHAGIDFWGLVRAVVRLGRDGGGSTISQQTAKNLFHEANYSSKLQRGLQKFKEWVMAVQLEKKFTKEEIVAIYFNTVPFSYGSVGIKTAAKTYFNKHPKDISPEEAAILVGMLKGPSLYNPRSRPENAIQRRNVVLLLMSQQGHFTTEQKDSLQALPLVTDFKSNVHTAGIGTYIRERIRLDLMQHVHNKKKDINGEPYNIYTDGLKIYTTIDSRMQFYAEQAVSQHIDELQRDFFKEWKGKDPWLYGDRANPELIDKTIKRSGRYKAMAADGKSHDEIMQFFNKKVEMTVYTRKGDRDTMMSSVDSIKHYKQMLQVGFLAVDPTNGHVKAWVGGPNFKYFQLDHVRTRRQVGSTIKPLLYSLGYAGALNPCTPLPYESPYAKWKPKGTGKWASGAMVEIFKGLTHSDNVVTAQVMHNVGAKALIKRLQELGVEAELPEVPSLSLGVGDISLYEMVQAYSTYANNGTYHEPTYISRIENKNGIEITVNALEGESANVLSEEEVYTTIENMKLVVKHGTGRRLGFKYKLTNPIAGKTGTTQGNSDGWFIGLTPQLIAGAWVGCDDPSVRFASTRLGQGANTGLPIWGLFFQKVYADKSLGIDPDQDFYKPKTMSDFTFDCSAERDSTFYGSDYN